MNQGKNVNTFVGILIVCVLIGMPLYGMIFNSVSSLNSEIIQEEIDEIPGIIAETMPLETIEDISIVLEVDELFGSNWGSIVISEPENFYCGSDSNYIYLCPNPDWYGHEDLTVTASYLFSPIPIEPMHIPVDRGIDGGEETLEVEQIPWSITIPLSINVLPVNDAPETVMDECYAVEMSTNSNMEMDEFIDLRNFFQDIDSVLHYSWISNDNLVTPMIEGHYLKSFTSTGTTGVNLITLMAYDGEFVATYDFDVSVKSRESLSFMEDSSHEFNINEYVDIETQNFEAYDSEHVLFEEYSEIVALVPEGDWYGDEMVSLRAYPKPQTDPPEYLPSTFSINPISIDPPIYEIDMLFGFYEFEVSVSNVNDPPVMSSVPAVLLNEDDNSVETFDINSYFYDIDSTLSYEVESANSKLSIGLDIDGRVDMTPAANWFGTENVVLSATDGEYTVSQEINVQVMPVNDPPFMTGETTSLEIDEDNNVTIFLDSYISDIDDALWFDCLCSNANTSLDINETTWETVIEPAENWNGLLEMVVYASDSEYQLARNLTLNVNAVNDAPMILSSVNQSFNEDQSLELDLDAFFEDVDSELSFITYSGDSALKCEPGENNTLSISTSANNWNGQAAITMVATDGIYTTEQDIIVNVIPVNDVPTARSGDRTLKMNEDTSITLELDDMFQDIDGDMLSYEFSSSAHLQLIYDNDGTIELRPTENWHGSLYLNIMASDGKGTATRAFDIDVESINDSPTLCASINPVLAKPGDTVTIDLSMYFSDVDASNLDFEVFGYENVLVTETDVSGVFQFTLPQDWEGTETIGIRASDGIDSVESEIFVSSSSPGSIIQTAAAPASPLQSMFWFGVGMLASVVGIAAMGRTRRHYAGKRAPAGRDTIF